MNRLRLVVPALLVSLALVPMAHAQGGPPADPRDTRCVLHVAGMEKAVVKADIAFHAHADTTLKFDLYAPPGRKAGARSGFVVFYNAGSGFSPSQRQWGIYRDWARLVTTRGLIAVVPDAVNGSSAADTDALFTHLRAHAAEYGLDMDRAAIWACSMHVNDGLTYAMAPAHPIRTAVIYYGMPDTLAVNPNRPVLMARAGLDQRFMVFSMRQWAERAVRRGLPLTWIDLPTLHHAFDAFEDDPLSRNTVRQTLDFLGFELSSEGIAARTRDTAELRARRLAAAQDWTGAATAAQAWLAETPPSPTAGEAHRILADARYNARDFATAAEHYERAGDARTDPAVTWYNAACCRALAGDRAKALDLLEKAFGTGFITDRAAVARDPDLSSIASDPRFVKLVTPPAGN